MRDVQYESQRIMIFPDYMIQVQKARKTFEAVKIKLRSMGLQYMRMFPAKLRVIHGGKTHFFTTSHAAWDWAKGDPEPQVQPGATLGPLGAPEGATAHWRTQGG